MRNKRLTIILSLFGMLLLIIDRENALKSAADAINQCVSLVIPSLFPFFFLSTILCSGIGLSKGFLPSFFQRMLGLHNNDGGLLLMGFLGGYPVGAQAVTTSWKCGRISQQKAARLLGFCNNAGPSFLFGLIGTLFSNPFTALIVWCIQILSALLAGFLLQKGQEAPCSRTAPSSLEETSASVALSTSLRITATVCGWVVLFRTLIGILLSRLEGLLPPEIIVIISGMLELTNGCINLSVISNEVARFVICSALLSFGGLCVALQTRSVTAGLELKYYYLGKLIQTSFSTILSWITALILFA